VCLVVLLSVDVKVEADSNDISEYPHYDQSSVGMIVCCILCSHLPCVWVLSTIE